MDGLTWTCHVCKRERPDAQIGVFVTDLSRERGLPLGTLKQNVRYCRDNPTCARQAPHVRLVEKPADEGGAPS